jgi:hypothetical protein
MTLQLLDLGHVDCLGLWTRVPGGVGEGKRLTHSNVVTSWLVKSPFGDAFLVVELQYRKYCIVSGGLGRQWRKDGSGVGERGRESVQGV